MCTFSRPRNVRRMPPRFVRKGALKDLGAQLEGFLGHARPGPVVGDCPAGRPVAVPARKTFLPGSEIRVFQGPSSSAFKTDRE